MTDPPFFYVHCDVPLGESLRSIRRQIPRQRFVARMVARIGDQCLVFFTPRAPSRQQRRTS